MRSADHRERTGFAALGLAAVLMVLASCGGSGTATSETDGPSVDAAAIADESTLPASPSPTSVPTTTPPASVAPTPTAAPDPRPTVAPAPTTLSTPLARYAERGPHPVGVVTRTVDDREVEIWYPASSTTNQPTEVFDALSAFPEQLRAIVPPELSGDYDTGAVRDATPVAENFPVLIYGHGFGGYRQIATHFTSHVASWGFVVVSMDHLERGIAEQTLDLIGAGVFDETNSRPDAAVDDVRDTIALLETMAAGGPFEAVMDLERLAISGHSAGAWAAVQAAEALPETIDGWISISGGTRDELMLTQAGLVIIAELDTVVPPERSNELFATAGVPTILINIAGAGHNSFTDPCRGITDLGGLGALVGLLGEEQVARAEDGCTTTSLEPEIAQAIVNQATIAWLNRLFDEPVEDDALDEDLLGSIGPLADYQVSDD